MQGQTLIKNLIVWGLVGMESVFFTAVHMVLCFRFETKPVLLTHCC